MQIDTLMWQRVTVTYDKPVGGDKKMNIKPRKEDVYERAYVSFDGKGLTIRDNTPGANIQKSTLLTRPVLVSIDPWKAVWTAYWWSSKIGASPGSTLAWKFDKLVKATVLCEF